MLIITVDDGEVISSDLMKVRGEYIAVVELQDTACKLYILPDAFVANPTPKTIEAIRASLMEQNYRGYSG